MNAPTPYPVINQLLQTLQARIQAILGPQFAGMYLFGSLVNGGFDQHSDIDFVLVTEQDLSDDLVAQLREMHEQVAHEASLSPASSLWARQIECSYIPRAALRHFDPNHDLHPHLDRGENKSLQWVKHGPDWVVQRYTLRERGLALSGPAPRTLIDPVSSEDLRQAMQAMLHGWATEILNNPDRLARRGSQAYTVLSLCRILYTLAEGEVISKAAAAQWARETLDPRWTPLIYRAWMGRQNPSQPAEPGDVQQTLNFIRYTLGQCES